MTGLSRYRRVPLLACPAMRITGKFRTAGQASSGTRQLTYGLSGITILGNITNMDDHFEHRKLVKHYHDPGDSHELTFSCFDRRPLLTNDKWREMLAKSIDRAVENYHYRLTAFVFMPEHVHLLIYPLPEAGKIEALLNAIKRPFSYRVKQLLLEANNPLLDQLTIRQRPGVTTFRFWQEGPGYDRNITKVSTMLSSIDYLHNNPIRRGLVKLAIDWKWSSARYYMIDPPQQYPTLPQVHSLPAEWLDEAG
jgi:putative transposase